jgi:hypothetical protein
MTIEQARHILLKDGWSIAQIESQKLDVKLASGELVLRDGALYEWCGPEDR